jgi:ABC-type amino acid transport substrate-binding protein
MEFVVDDPVIVTYNSEVPGLAAVEDGDIDAFLCSEPVGLAAIEAGAALKVLERDAYYTHKTGYVDRDLHLAPEPFLQAVNDALDDLHAGGRLKELSVEFFGKDYATPAGAFDLANLDQAVP